MNHDTDPAPDRTRLVRLSRVYQEQAAARPDPLQANLGVIAGDLMAFAHALAQRVETALLASAPRADGRAPHCHELDSYLRIVKQIERFALVERQLATVPRGPSSEG